MSPCGLSVNLEDLYLVAPVLLGQTDCLTWADKGSIQCTCQCYYVTLTIAAPEPFTEHMNTE